MKLVLFSCVRCFHSRLGCLLIEIELADSLLDLLAVQVQAQKHRRVDEVQGVWLTGKGRLEQLSKVRSCRVHHSLVHHGCLVRHRLERLLLRLRRLVHTLLVSALILVHAIHGSSSHIVAHLASTTSAKVRLFCLALIQYTVWALLNLLFFEFDSSYLAINIVDGVFELFLQLFRLLELLFNQQAVVGLQNLLVDEVAPRFRIQSIIEVELISSCLVVVAHSRPSTCKASLVFKCKSCSLELLLHILDFLIDLGLQVAARLTVLNDGSVCVEADLVFIDLETNGLLPASVNNTFLHSLHFFFKT